MFIPNGRACVLLKDDYILTIVLCLTRQVSRSISFPCSMYLYYNCLAVLLKSINHANNKYQHKICISITAHQCFLRQIFNAHSSWQERIAHQQRHQKRRRSIQMCLQRRGNQCKVICGSWVISTFCYTVKESYASSVC